MAQISINHLSFTYKQYVNPIFQDISLQFDTDWRLGLIGRNGRGKTTLLKLLSGGLAPDRGSISKPVSMELFPYDFDLSYENALDVVLENIGGLKSMEIEMESLLSQGEEALSRYGDVLTRYLALDGYGAQSRILKELALFQMDEALLKRPFSSLSGGEQTRLLLLALFLRPNPFVLMDEPTNHLDIAGRQALLKYLQKKQGFILVSHDRALLDGAADHIMSINKTDITIEKGNYTTFKTSMELKETYELRTRERLQREVEHLEKLAQDKRQWSGRVEGKRYPFASNARGFDSRSAALMRHAKTAERKAEKNLAEKKTLLANMEKPQRLHFVQEEAAGSLVSLNGVCFAYGESEVLRDVTFSVQSGDIIWIRGQNGTGKSTLLRLIAGELAPSKGVIARRGGLRISYAAQQGLCETGMLQDLFHSREAYGRCLQIAGLFDLTRGHLSRPVETLSSGEQKKLAIARALATDNQLLLMDEPLNFMDILFREQFFSAVKACAPTMLFVEHDEWFSSGVATSVITLPM